MADLYAVTCCVVCCCPPAGTQFVSADRTLERSGSSLGQFLQRHGVAAIGGGETYSFVCQVCDEIIVRCDEFEFSLRAELDALRRRAPSSEAKPLADGDPLLVVVEEESKEASPEIELWSDPMISNISVDESGNATGEPTFAVLESLELFSASPPSFVEADDAPATAIDIGSSEPALEEMPGAEVEKILKTGIDHVVLEPEKKSEGKKKKRKDGDKGDGRPRAEGWNSVCPLCSEKCEPGKYSEHFRTAHPERKRMRPLSEEPYRCSLCPFVSRVKYLLVQHQLLKHDIGVKKHVCADCGEAFKRADPLTSHRVRVHGAETPFSCATCGKSYDTSIGLYMHKKTKHPDGASDRVCAECGEVVPRALYWNHVHKKHRVREVRYYPCDRCGVKFTERRGLTRHLAKRHGVGEVKDPDPSVCAECGKRLKSPKLFRAHMKTQHGVELPGLKTYACDSCEEVFYVKQLLDAHVMLHTGEYKFKCAECGYSTRFSGNLTKHVNLVHKKCVTQNR